MAVSDIRVPAGLRSRMTNADLARAPAPAPAKKVAPEWGDPPRQPVTGEAPILSAEGFEGPLDWLLELARAQKIDVAKMPIAVLIQSFADALDAALARANGPPPDLARWGD